MPTSAKVYISLVSAVGVAAMAYAFADPPWTHDIYRFGAYLLLSLLAATLKLRLPGLTSTMSIGFVFVLLGVSELTLPEAMLIAALGALVQCLWRAKPRPSFVQVLFGVSAVAASLMLAYQAAHFVRTQWHSDSIPIPLAVATCLYFTANSLLVSGVLSLVKQQPLRTVWQQCYLFAFPYYLLGGTVVGMMTASGRDLGWQPPLLLLPVMALAYLFYRIYLGRMTMAAATLTSATPLHTVKTRSA